MKGKSLKVISVQKLPLYNFKSKMRNEIFLRNEKEIALSVGVALHRGANFPKGFRGVFDTLWFN
jgi:hypothetical protein